jgi:hypothetical protein
MDNTQKSQNVVINFVIFVVPFFAFFVMYLYWAMREPEPGGKQV